MINRFAAGNLGSCILPFNSLMLSAQIYISETTVTTRTASALLWFSSSFLETAPSSMAPLPMDIIKVIKVYGKILSGPPVKTRLRHVGLLVKSRAQLLSRDLRSIICTSLAGEANPQRSGCTTSTRATILVPQNVILPTKETSPPSDNAVIARHNLCCRQWPEPSLNINNQPIRAPLPH
jgi:hypothetical protein